MRTKFLFVYSLWIMHRCSAQFGSAKQAYGFVEFRSGCHLFYWLFYAMEMGSRYTERPLLIWLQGGPGSSSTGHGNFLSVGPLDINLNTRETTWAKKYNLLFIDSPVGSGYSYFERSSCLMDTNEEVGEDLVDFMKEFYRRHPELMAVPLYITGQAYGAKFAVDFALLFEEKIGSNILKGVALGSPWISPINLVARWSPTLEALGFVDYFGASDILQAVLIARSIYNRYDYRGAVMKCAEVQRMITEKTFNIDFYNITNKAKYDEYESITIKKEKRVEDKSEVIGKKSRSTEDKLNVIMNHLVRKALKIPSNVIWGSQSKFVGDALLFDFLKPVTRRVGLLLNTTAVKVFVYNGNLNLLCGIQGQQTWVSRLDWYGSSGYRRAPRNPIWIGDELRGYVKGYAGFKFYWILGAGHQISQDNPEVEAIMLQNLTGF